MSALLVPERIAPEMTLCLSDQRFRAKYRETKIVIGFMEAFGSNACAECTTLCGFQGVLTRSQIFSEMPWCRPWHAVAEAQNWASRQIGTGYTDETLVRMGISDALPGLEAVEI